MFGSVVLEVVLGSVFGFAAFSLVCSALVELLDSVRGQRGKLLAGFVERMLGPELKNQFYGHGLIRSQSTSGRLPSYLSARSFARVTLDLLELDAATFRQKIDGLEGEVGQTLRTLTKDVTDLEQVRERIEQWFDCAMERCSGVYRRRARWAAFSTGLVIAALLNVDALEIASALYADAHLRTSVVAQAEAEGQVPIGRRATADGAPSVLSIPVESGTLPLGWENSRFATRTQFADRAWRQPEFWYGPMLSKILGLIATALATSIGAGLWFVALRRTAWFRANNPPGSCVSATRD